MKMADWLTEDEKATIESGISEEEFQELYHICLSRKRANDNLNILRVVVVSSLFLVIAYIVIYMAHTAHMK